MCHLKQIGKVKKFDKRALHEVKSLSRVRLFATPWTVAYRPWDSPGRNTAVGCHFFLQGIFPTQGSNLCLLCLLHCRWILYPLNHLISVFDQLKWDSLSSVKIQCKILSDFVVSKIVYHAKLWFYWQMRPFIWHEQELASEEVEITY